MVGNAVVHMQRQHLIRWLDLAANNRDISSKEGHQELSKMRISPKLTKFVYRNVRIRPIPEPKWISVKKEDSLHGAFLAETSAADRQFYEIRKSFRTSDITSNNDDATDGITASDVLTWKKKCGQFKFSLIKIDYKW